MDVTIEELNREEAFLRRRLIVIAGVVMVLMFFWLSLVEIDMGRIDLAVMTASGAVISAANVVYARWVGYSIWLLRFSLAFCLGVAVYNLQTDFVASSLLYFLLFPFAMAALLGFRESMVWSLGLGVMMVGLIFHAINMGYGTTSTLLVDFVCTYAFIVCVAMGYEKMRETANRRSAKERQRLVIEIDKNNRLFEDLTDAMQEVRELNELLPICANCKKVRSDEDFWEHVEAYLHRRTQLTFSHSLCPTCSYTAMAEVEADGREAARRKASD